MTLSDAPGDREEDRQEECNSTVMMQIDVSFPSFNKGLHSNLHTNEIIKTRLPGDVYPRVTNLSLKNTGSKS